MSSDLERRLAQALEARAGQVRPEDLVPRELPTPDHGRGPRAVWVGLAAAACLAVVGAGVVVPRLLADPDAAQPPPADGEVSPPPDVGRDWEPVRGVRGAVDLDGDGTPDRVRLRGEPDPDFAGRTRLDVRLSGGGSAYGVVDLGTTLYSYSPRGADLDGDGGEELVLVVDVDGTTTEPRVLDLRDDVLVEAAVPAGEDTPLLAGAVRAGTDRATGIRLDRVADWWVEDGSLRSSVSEGAYPALGMSWFVPDPYVAQVVSWRLEDGDLLPDLIEADACISRLEEERRPCEPGEEDGVPDLGPVSTTSIGPGESSPVSGPVPATVSLSAGGGQLEVRVGGEVVALGVDRGTRVLTRAVESVAQDGVGLALDTDDDGVPDELKTIAVERDGSLRAKGPFLLGSGTSWLSEDGTLFTRTGDDATGAGVDQWTETRDGPVRVPLGTFCVPDGDVTAAESC